MKAYFKIVVMSIILVVTLFMFVATTYAWFVKSKNTEEVVINTGFLLTKTNFYVYEEDTWKERTKSVKLEHILPGVEYKFKLDIKAVGNVDGYLSIYINKVNVTNLDFLKCFDVHYINPTTSVATSVNMYDMFTYNNNTIDDHIPWFLEYVLKGNDDLLANPTDDDRLEFIFTIVGNGSLLGNEYKNEILDITQLAIKLEQIPHE